MISAKMATPVLLKITVFWIKGYIVIIPVDDVISKILSRDSIYILDVFMWPNFGNSSISMRKVITTSILQGFDQENAFFEGWSSLKFNNLGLALVTNLKFYTSVAKGWKLKVKKFWGLICTFLEVTGEKLVEGFLCPLHFPDRVKETTKSISKSSVRSRSQEYIFRKFYANIIEASAADFIYSKVPCSYHILLYSLRGMWPKYENYSLKDLLF